MFRRWISGFWRKYKDKIIRLGKGVFLIIIISFFATIINLNISQNQDIEENQGEIYNPTSTVLIGSDISEEVYEENSQAIGEFIEYCNSRDAKNAYNLISNDCKEMLFPTLEDFKNNYLDKIFDEKRTYNLQSWIVKDKFVTYRIRILNDLLSTGSYTESVKYEDYITIDNSNEESKISINGFVKTEEINLETQTEEFYAKVLERNIYMDYEEYVITIKNLTDNTVLMDSLENEDGIVLVGNNNENYYVEDVNEVYFLGSKLNSQATIKLTIKFKKKYSINVKTKYIEFKNIIENIEKYESEKYYKCNFTLKINL